MRSLIIWFIVMFPLFASGQNTFENEHYKYWYYRE